MLRTALIFLTILATTLGSLGLPIYLHTCRMIAVAEDPAGCPMCAERDDADANRPVVPVDDDGGSCCGSSVLHQRVDSGTSYRADLPMPLLVGIVAWLDLELDEPSAVTAHRGDIGHSPPALAERTRHTYLHNASFLI